MKYDDLSFEIVEDGITYKCDVTKIINNTNKKEEPYVVYTNYDLDENDEFIEKYGKLITSNDNYYIETNLLPEEIKYIKEMEKDEIVQYVNGVIDDVLDTE